MNKKKTISSTEITHTGLKPKANFGIPNPPVYHASTILYPNSKSRREKKIKFQYGRTGTPTSNAFCDTIAELYNADGSILAPSGLAAAVVGILSFVKNGSHILVADSAYGSTRNFITNFLPSIGVDIEFYEPRIKPQGLKKIIKKKYVFNIF